jgi:hypothetical protein
MYKNFINSLSKKPMTFVVLGIFLTVTGLVLGTKPETIENFKTKIKSLFGKN